MSRLSTDQKLVGKPVHLLHGVRYQSGTIISVAGETVVVRQHGSNHSLYFHGNPLRCGQFHLDIRRNCTCPNCTDQRKTPARLPADTRIAIPGSLLS